MTGHPAVLDTAASIGPDFVCIDTQHGRSLAKLDSSAFTVLAQYGIPSLVRVEALSGAHIGRALDLGADGVVIPLIETAEDAARAVAATRYAPAGKRSYGVQTRRLAAHGGPDPICWIQIETREAMENLNDIASVDGVDSLYVGPADLGLALVGEPATDVVAVFDGSHPRSDALSEALDAVVSACENAGIVAGLHCGSGRAAAMAHQRGFGITAVAADLALIARGLAAELAEARTASG